MFSTYDLAYERTRQIGPCALSVKLQILEEIREQLDAGWTDEDVRHGTKRQGDNLLDPYRFYYHSQLHIASPPPRISVDLETGEITEATEPWFLEMRASYTLHDLYRYYMGRLLVVDQQADRVRGAFKWLVNNYDLEHVLFMIDVYRSVYDLGQAALPLSPLSLREYEHQAIEALEQKQTEMVTLGVTKIVPRQREPLPVC